MKSSFVFNLLFSVILAVAAYILLPLTGFSTSAEFGLAIGILIGGIIVPLLSGNKTPADDSPAKSSTKTTTLYVGNLPYRANEDAVMEHFATSFQVHSVRLMKDRRTGKRKGYGFVEMAAADADKAIEKFNDTEFQDRTLKVRLAREKSSAA
ncbi:RNA recognition motif domain-containing protein [Aestuariibacter salexigens]|uniref:RNA recognition motif domain-containing protein n=1 Tax=Aestuariibacter salexigens TaxID=226010 RepID=UPI0003FF26B5|nr:RNA-binding protein [Aestuariibacter salexigens]